MSGMRDDPSGLAQIQRRGLMLVLSSPSGAGKTTISRRLLSLERNLTMSVSATTRPMRPGEKEGRQEDAGGSSERGPRAFPSRTPRGRAAERLPLPACGRPRHSPSGGNTMASRPIFAHCASRAARKRPVPR